MTELLEKAFSEAEKLSGEEQDALARWILAEIESERHWSVLFAGSLDVLERMADQALADLDAGNTEALDPDKL